MDIQAKKTSVEIQSSSSKDEDSARKAEASVLQWLYKVNDCISAISEDYPVYIETPDWMNLIHRSLPLSGHEDSCGHDGYNYEDYQGENYRSKEPCFEDGTWITIRIRIPQTILELQHNQ